MKHLSALFLIPLLAACSPASHELRMGGKTMGTTWSLILIDANAEPARIQAQLDSFEAIFSTWNRDSEICRFNRQPSGVPFPVSAALREATGIARTIHAHSGGAFDPTVGPLVAAWGFGPSFAADPSAQPCFEAITVDDANGTLTKTRPDATLDLTALVEGYALDSISAWLVTTGCQNFLLEVGGELKAIGPGPGDGGWIVGIQQPGAAQGQQASSVRLRDEAIATSGTYVQHSASGGTHLIDPRTRRPVFHDTVAVTVIAPSAVRADAWATALVVLGEAEGRPIAEREGLEAIFLVRRPGNNPQEASASSRSPLTTPERSVPVSSADSGTRSK